MAKRNVSFKTRIKPLLIFFVLGLGPLIIGLCAVRAKDGINFGIFAVFVFLCCIGILYKCRR